MTTVDRGLYGVVGLLSGAALAHEVLLLRLFSIAYWPDVAHLVISLALLGTGASGTLIALRKPFLISRYRTVIPICCTLFGLSAVACTVIAMRLPLHAGEFVWDVGQWGLLATAYLLLAVPFLCAATAIGLALLLTGDRPGPMYAADLVGAGVGSVAILILLQHQFPGRSLALVGCSGIVAGALAVRVLTGRCRVGCWILLILATLVATAPETVLAPRTSEFKPLAQYLRIPGAHVVVERSGPEGHLTAISNEQVPMRHGPGMVLGSGHEPPAQIAVFRDGAAPQAISRGDPRADLRFLSASPAFLPYMIRAPRSVLVLNAGSGGEVQRALLAGAESVTALESHRPMVDLVRDDFPVYSAGLYTRADVQVHVSDSRHPTTRLDDYDLVVDSLHPPGTSERLLVPAYGRTAEAIQVLLAAMASDGILAFNTWIDLPPRTSLRLLATAEMALHENGIDRPDRHLALFRGWQTAVLLVSARPFTQTDIQEVRAAAGSLRLDAIHFPGVRAEETNRYHQLTDDWFRRGARAILGPKSSTFADNYPFNIKPLTDDQPYLGYSGRWGTFLNALFRKDSGGLALISPGFFALLATLAQATLLAGLVVVLPMAVSRQTRGAMASGHQRLTTLCYFGAIGLGFMLLEITAIQRAILFVGQPTYGAAIVIGGFLVFAALGSIASTRLPHGPGRHPMFAIALAIALSAAITLVFASNLVSFTLAWPLWARLVATLAFFAPLAFFLGMPFPIGLAALARDAPDLRPWAWGINGCASVIGAVLAALLALEFGLNATTLLAIVLYGISAAARLGPDTPGSAR